MISPHPNGYIATCTPPARMLEMGYRLAYYWKCTVCERSGEPCALPSSARLGLTVHVRASHKDLTR